MNVALILAKSGSVGLPGKNLLEFQGKPLLIHTLDEILRNACFDDVYVSTNGDTIARTAQNYGVKVIMRADEYAGNDRYVDSVYHAVRSIQPRPMTITIPQVVQPLREPGLFQQILSLQGPGVDSVVTVTRFESSVDWIYARDGDTGLLRELEKINYTQDTARRDDLFEIDNSVVSFTYRSWKLSRGLTPWPYLGRNIIGVEQKGPNVHYRIDINTPDDAEWLEFISEFPEWKRRRQ